MISIRESSILSIDYGERFFGFAIKLKDETTIFPLKVIDSKGINIYKNINLYIAEYKVNVIIVGYPIGLSGKSTRVSDLVDIFIKDLQVINGVEVFKIDERFSSKINKFNQGTRTDSSAALINLETYIKNND